MKDVIFINPLVLRFKGMPVFSFWILKNYQREKSILRIFSMSLFPSCLLKLMVCQGLLLYGDLDLKLVNTFELDNLSRPWSKFLQDFLQLYQNILRYPGVLDVDYSFEKLPLSNHQLKCFIPLLSLNVNTIDHFQLEGVALRGVDQGVIFKGLRDNFSFSNIDLADIELKGCNISTKLVFFALLGMNFVYTKKWKNWLEFVKKNLVWYEYFLSVERAALISDLGYKFDFIPLSGFNKDYSKCLAENHTLGPDLSFGVPNDGWVDSSYLDVCWLVDVLRGEGLRKKLDPFFRELAPIRFYFDIIFKKSFSQKIGKVKKVC